MVETSPGRKQNKTKRNKTKKQQNPISKIPNTKQAWQSGLSVKVPT
jgi:hypothetical protein